MINFERECTSFEVIGGWVQYPSSTLSQSLFCHNLCTLEPSNLSEIEDFVDLKHEYKAKSWRDYHEKRIPEVGNLVISS